MTVRDYRTVFVEKLQSVYDLVEAESLFYLVLEHKLQLKRIDLALKPELELSNFQIEEWDHILSALLQEVPIQYLLGSTSFYGLEFEVNQNVLIPRPETEELVDWIVSLLQIRKSGAIEILDIGTGSGCIAVAISKYLQNAMVTAIDVSQEAITLAQKNAGRHSVGISFIRKDILQTDDLNESFDCIVSNPPYVRLLEKESIKKNVLDHEPHLALFVDDQDPLLFYRKIGFLAFNNLKFGGLLFFEINQYLGAETVVLLKEIGFESVFLKKDIYGNDRMICASKQLLTRSEVLL